MIAESLRKSILQAAIQGKLTKQLPEDGDARELLAEIKAEKARLIEEGKIKKEKPLPEITEDEIPFDIPDNWCWVRLGDIISVSSGRGLTQNDMEKQGKYPVYGGNGINGSHSEWFVPKDTIVIGRVGFYCGCIHKVINNCWVTDNALIVQVKKDIYDIDFLQLVLRELDLKSTSVSTAQPVISGMRIYPKIIPVPPKPEQRRILEKLDKILPLIDKLEKDELKLDLLQKSFPKKMKDSLLQAAIQGKLTEQLESDGDARDLVADIKKEKERLIKEGKIKKEKPLPEITEDEIPFDIPDNWCWVRLGDIGETNIGLTYKPSDVSINGTLVLRSGNIQNDKMDYSDNLYVNCDIPESKKCHVGDILICARNGSKKLVGKAAIVDQEGMTFGAFMALYRSPFNRYIHKYLSSPYFRSDLDGVSTTTINQITQNNLKERLVPLPPLAEQVRIVEKLEQLLPLCDALE